MKIENYKLKIQNQDGQLLIELLIALFVGGLFLLGTTLGVTSIMRYSFETRGNQAASGFAKDMLDNATLIAQTDWHGLYDVSKGSANHYFFAPSASTTAVIAGDESMLFSDTRANLIGQWKFDESSGSVAYDTSGNALHATLYNSPTQTASTSCIASTCLTLNGTNQYGNVGTSTVFAATSALTITAWIRTAGIAEAIIVDNKAGGYNGYTLQQAASNPNYASFSVADASADRTVTGITAINDNQWHFIAGVFNAGVLYVYVDGSQDASTTASFTSITPPTKSLRLGSGALGGGYFNGLLDDIRVYTRALSANEINDLYRSPIFTRYVVVENVNRDGNGDISSSGTDDPSTQKISISVLWEGGRNIHLYRYIMRDRTAQLQFSTWSGGPGNAGVITEATSTFATSSNITYDADSYLTLTTTTASGWLESPIFDTQITGGAAVNSILWQGTQPSGTVVRFQFAPSNSDTGPWNYYGEDGSGTTYFTASANVSASVTNTHNYRYVRYKVFLEPSGGSGPTVDDVIINWSK